MSKLQVIAAEPTEITIGQAAFRASPLSIRSYARLQNLLPGGASEVGSTAGNQQLVFSDAGRLGILRESLRREHPEIMEEGAAEALDEVMTPRQYMRLVNIAFEAEDPTAFENDPKKA